MGLVLAVVGVLAVLLALGALFDRRDRRRGHRRRAGLNLASTFRENRRDIRAWEHGTPGVISPDVSWMAHRHPGRFSRAR